MKGTKYRNHKTIVAGNVFASKREANRWLELKHRETIGEITGLDMQVPFVLIPTRKTPSGTNRSVKYIADFVYYENGQKVVEDVKGFRTDVYKLKKKLMWEIFKIDVKEV